ncbi:MAG: hypothetical protein WB611_21715 [Stellaceae bacterium]
MHPLNAAAQATGWEADWAWSLPLIILTVVIHVFGLGLLHERVVHAVARIIARRHFTAMFAAVMGIAVLLITVLHATEAWVWALAYWVLGALPELRSSVLFSLGAMTTYGGSDVDLQQHWRLMGAIEALNGIILFGLTTAFLFSMIQEVGMVNRERHRRH